MPDLAVARGTVFDNTYSQECFALVQFRHVQADAAGAVGGQPGDVQWLAVQRFTFRTHLREQGVIIQAGEP